MERLIASEFFGRSVDQDELTQLLGSLMGSDPLRVRLLLNERGVLRMEQKPFAGVK